MAAAHSQPTPSFKGRNLVSRFHDRANKLITAFETTMMEIHLLKKELQTPMHANENPAQYKLHQIAAKTELDYLNTLVTVDPKDYAKQLILQIQQILQQGGLNNEQVKMLKKDIEALKTTFKF